MPSCQLETKKILIIFIIVLLTIIFTVGIVEAQNNQGSDVSSIDSHFDDVRGQLIGFYGSQIVSHTGIILGLIIVIPSLGPKLFRLLMSKRFALCLFALLIILLLGTLIVYNTGRLFYWSSLDAYLEHATKQKVEIKLDITITGSNATSCMDALSNYTVISTESGIGLSSISNLIDYPINVLAIIVGTAVCVLVSVVLWKRNNRIPEIYC